jgi:hypothetical protein
MCPMALSTVLVQPLLLWVITPKRLLRWLFFDCQLRQNELRPGRGRDWQDRLPARSLDFALWAAAGSVASGFMGTFEPMLTSIPVLF